MSQIVEERRAARIGTVSGLALLAGSTAVAAVAGGTHSIFATILLGLLTFGLGHSLMVEVRRQARRLSPGWTRQDTINAVLLGIWAEIALIITILETGTGLDRAVGLTLAMGYAASCGYFVTERRRAISEPLTHTHADEPAPTAKPASALTETHHAEPPTPASTPVAEPPATVRSTAHSPSDANHHRGVAHSPTAAAHHRGADSLPPARLAARENPDRRPVAEPAEHH